MSRAREIKSLQMTEYDIAGNAIRAYYDNSNNLIFILDETINADKPNVLLVIDSFDGRKWDEVLVNDYGVDLETVRPKRDNKYQKLDIEYGGLDVYSELIDANQSGGDLVNAVENLMRFRAMSVRRAATERLSAANETIEKSRETIERTKDAISDLRTRVKDLRARVSEYRGGIGREPTKASAAKILKAEAQLDATNEKLARAKKRLNNAQHRLTNAEEDAEIARSILARDVPIAPKKKSGAPVRNVQPVIVNPAVPVADADYDIEDTEEIIPEQKAEKMADEEVKPLFDKDPENLDDEIAFKPIDFATVEDDHKEQTIAPEPLSFVPPTQKSDEYETSEISSAPMLDGLNTVPSEVLHEEVKEVLDGSEEKVETVIESTEPVSAEPFVPDAPIVPAPSTRPVSSITGGVTPVNAKPQKTTFMYYLMLVLLILLSIGTLWLYQKSTSENVPDLAKTVETTVATSETKSAVADEKVDANPFVITPNIVKEKIVEEPVVAPVPEPVAVSVVEPESVSVEPEPVVAVSEVVEVIPETIDVDVAPVAVVVEPAAVVVEDSPFLEPEPAITKIATYEPEPVRIPSEEEVIASKPGYNVSQNEKMFVAAPDYDTETVVDFDEYAEEDSVPTCEGGAAPDSLGCCPGENYTYTDDGFMCCSADECFPPLQ